MFTKSLRLTVAVAVLVGVPGAAPGQPPSAPSEQVDDLLARAMALHQAGDLLGAVQNYLVALEARPERADIRSNLGAAYVALGRFTEGIDEYRKALVAVSDPTIRLNLALALYKARRVDEAVPELEQVLQHDPGNRQAALVLADCLLQLGRDQEVIDLLTAREADFQEDLAYAYLLGTALIRTDEVERGQVLVDRIFQRGESAEAHLLLGMAYVSRRDYLAALKELARAVELNPELDSVQATLGRALLGSGDQAGAVRAFRKELEINPNNFEANLQLGNLYRLDQRYADALVYLQRAEAAQPANPSVRHGLAAAYLGLNQPERARELLEAAIHDTPSFVDAHVLLATTYYRLRRKDDGDRHRAIVERLTAEAQSRQPGAQPAEPPGSVGSPPELPRR